MQSRRARAGVFVPSADLLALLPLPAGFTVGANRAGKMLLGHHNAWLPGLLVALALSACSSSHFEPLQMQGRPVMVEDAGQHRLWVLGKQEEVRQVGIGNGTRSANRWRSDTFFHFVLRAFDPTTAQPLWTRRLWTLGDPDARGPGPSRVIGSSVEARLLGQDGERVWLLIGSAPLAVSSHDGRVLADTAAIEQRNPSLRGMLPAEAKYYAFDRGLVLMTADARRMVIRGAELEAGDYSPEPTPIVEPEHHTNGRERIVPTMPAGEIPVRHATLAGQRLGLYADREAADAVNDAFGDRLRYPYTVLDEGAKARRILRRGTIVEAQRFDERFPRLSELQPIADSPVFLKGRFLKDPTSGEALHATAPDGLLVWHSTRIDQAGRLALTRLDDTLHVLWDATLPLSESGTGNPLSTWLVAGRLVAIGAEETFVDDMRRREQHLVCVDLTSGRWRGWDLTGERALP
jgi:hypothetical protein